MTKKELKKYLEDHGVEANHLDETCHTTASELASSANNDGLEGQINFLIDTCGWSVDNIITAMKEYIE